MEDEDRDLTQLVKRGFAGMAEQLRERDDRYTRLNENLIRMEGDLKALNATVERIDITLSKAESDSIRTRMDNAEKVLAELKAKSSSNDAWRLGLLVSIILLLAGVISNFIAARMK